MSNGPRAFGWRWFGGWGVIGGSYCLALLLLFFALLVMPIIGLATLVVTTRSRLWPEVLGLALGPAATALIIGYFRWGPRPCPEGSTCGPDSPALPWFLAGCLLALPVVAAYAVLARRAGSVTEVANDQAAIAVLQARTSPKAVASLALGIASLVVAPIIAPLLAIAFGAVAKRDISTNPGLSGERLALAGIGLGLFAPLVAFGLYYVLFFRILGG